MATRGVFGRLLSQLKGEIVQELDVARILPQLVQKRVFTVAEEREILSSSDLKFRADVFVERLASKGADAFDEFCVALESTNPRLLTRLLKTRQDNLAANSPPSKAPSHMTTSYDTAALQERDGVDRLNSHRLHDDLEAARRQYHEMKHERDEALSTLESIRNQQRPSARDADAACYYGNQSVPVSRQNGAISDPASLLPPGSKNLESIGNPDLERGWTDESGEKVVWETQSIVLTRVVNYGFGIAVTGGKDNPHFANGDPAIVVSDVLKSGPADGKLFLGDRILSVNNIPLDNVEHSVAIAVLRDSGATASLVIRRKVTLTPGSDFEQPFKVTLNKKNKKDDYGIVLGYKLYIKEITPNSLAALEGNLREGDTIIKMNSSSAESLSLNDARKQMEKSKDRLQLVIAKTSHKRTVGSAPLPTDVRMSQQPSQMRPAHLPISESNPKQPVMIVDLDRPMIARYPGPSLDRQYPLPPGQELLRQNYPGYLPQRQGPAGSPPLKGHNYHAISGHDHPVGPGSGYPPPPIGPVPGRDYQPGSEYPDSNAPPTDYGYGRQDDVNFFRRPVHDQPEPHVISFKKEGGVGIRISGGNRTGIFVARVAPNTPAERQGLSEGDMIIKVNDVDVRGKTREEAVLLLLSLNDHITLLVQQCRPEYERLMADGGTGDLFYIRTHFNYEVTEHGEMAFKHGDIFQITDTLYSGVVGSWQAIRIARTSHEARKGIIPNLNRAEQLAVSQSADKENLPSSTTKSSNRGSSFFKKKTAWRAKSLGHEHWEDAMFVGGKSSPGGQRNKPGSSVTKFPAYERVILKDVGFIRPVVILGPLADVAREKLAREHSDWFELPQSDVVREGERIVKSGIIRLTAIRDIIDRRKHALLDVTPNAVDRLNFTQYAPIVVYLKAESKHAVKELRQHWVKNSNKSPRKLYEHALRLEKSWSHLFTHTIALTNGEMWYRKLKEAIEKSQLEKIWMSETKPEPLKDDLSFPMNRRLSFVSSPESDMDATIHGPYSEDEADLVRPPPPGRLVRSTSDPSIGAADNIPGSGGFYPGTGMGMRDSDVYQPRYRAPGPGLVAPSIGYPPRREWTSSIGLGDDRYFASRPDEQLHRGYRGDTTSPRKPYPPYTNRPRSDYYGRSSIDPYATLTPSERMRYQATEADRRFHDPFYPGPYSQDSLGSHGPPLPPPTHSPVGPSSGVRGMSPQQDQGRSSKMPPPPPGDGGGYVYRAETRPPNYNKKDDERRFNTGSSFGNDTYSKYTANPLNRHDDSKLQEKFGGPLDDAYRMSKGAARPYETQAVPNYRNASYRSSDRSDGGSFRSDDPNAIQSYPYGKPSAETWRTKSDTNLSREPSLSYPATMSSFDIDRNPEAEGVRRENLENRMRSQYPYSQISAGDVSNKRDSAPNRYIDAPPSRGSNVPPAKPPHLPYTQYNGLSAPQLPLHQDSPPIAGDKMPRGTERQTKGYGIAPQRIVNDREVPFASRGSSGPFEGKPPSSPSTSSTEKQRDSHSSAFESYRKPENESSTGPQQRDGPMGAQEDNHTIVATARGVFDSNGGILESKETGVAIVIPKGAIPEAVKQEIYFKVCRDNNILPPLDKEKGETLLSPLVMCGPHGLKFLQPVELRLPHSASVNPESWSFALKSSDSPTGHPTHWQNVALAGADGASQGKVSKNSVSVLVDHF